MDFKLEFSQLDKIRERAAKYEMAAEEAPRHIARFAVEAGNLYLKNLKASAPEDSGALKSKLRIEVSGGGSDWLIKPTSDVPYLKFVINDTAPHLILPVRAPALAFFWKKVGKPVKLPRVQHPGTKANRFDEKAMGLTRPELSQRAQELIKVLFPS
jgi:hypothetical protein